jgi:xanthine/CO dehydrogenase XdhC/CoxF family maturation factor
VLVTVVRVNGSSYRRPGARLLLGESGEYAGSISGGCLETEIVRKAVWKVREGAVIERYSTLFDDTAEVPFGLGCGGVIDLLLEPVETLEGKAMLTAMEHALKGERSKVVTWLPGEGKTLRRMVLSESDEILFASEGLGDKKLACAHGLQAGEVYEGRFVEEMRVPQRLFVLGAGDDARPLVAMATMMGWSVVVADGRTHLARRERFPEAERVLALEEGGFPGLGIQRDDAVVVMTHSYEQDRALLASVLPIAPRYLGMLGARHRSSLLVSEASAMAALSIEQSCERIWAPVGLDLGGEGPESIALAVMAEVQAVCMGRLGASRRLTPQDVSRYVSEGGAARYLAVQCAS